MSKIKIHNVRPFIYRERESIESFLEESQLWKDIYEVFLRVKDNAYYLKVPSVKMFNEVRYQCVRLMLDKHPEENVYVNYLNNARDTLGWRYASDLCFSMVYAVMSLIKNTPMQVTHFCTILSENRLKGDRCYFPYFNQLVEEKKTTEVQYEIDLSPMPESPKVIRNTGYNSYKQTTIGIEGVWVQTYDNGWWKRQTLDFDSGAIQEIIALWSDPQEQQEITQRIDLAKAFYEESILSHQRVLDLFSGTGGLDVKNLKIQSLISAIESVIKEKDTEIQELRAQKRTMEKETSDLKAELEKRRKEISYLKYGYDEEEYIPSYEQVPPEVLAKWAEEAAEEAKYATYDDYIPEDYVPDDAPDLFQLLQESQQRESELREALEQERKQKAEKEGQECLPMDAFITYAEKHYPADQNTSAKILKEALGDVYNIRRIDDETYERWRLLGTKESFDDRMAESMKRIAERPTMKDNNGIVAGGDFTAKITPTDAQMNMLADKLVQTTETKNLTK